MSKRRNLGIDRVFLNCAVCHASTFAPVPTRPQLYLACRQQTRLSRFFKLLFNCAGDEKFSSAYVVPAIQQAIQQNGRQAGLVGIAR